MYCIVLWCTVPNLVTLTLDRVKATIHAIVEIVTITSCLITQCITVITVRGASGSSLAFAATTTTTLALYVHGQQ
jgi:hypothetical protein